MSSIKAARITLRYLLQSIRAQYGSGISGFFKFIYYSFLRLNSFIVFACNDRGAAHLMKLAPQLRVERKVDEYLHSLRRKNSLPREFYCDEAFGVNDFFLGIWEADLAYIHWVFHAGSKSRFLEIGENCAEINYMLTLPAFRRKNICSMVIKHTVNELFKDGIQTIFCVIHSENIASIKAIKNSGFREIKRVLSIGPFNIRMNVVG
jgi:hypothetical protein